MSHSYQHSQPQQRRLSSQFLHHNQQFFNIISPQTSLSPSHSLHKLTSTTTTTSFSFFHNKHYLDYQDEPITPPYTLPCCFNILSHSKRFKFHVSNMDHHLQLDHFSSFKSPSQIIVSFILILNISFYKVTLEKRGSEYKIYMYSTN